ncbi:hypothetical protein F5050DRAFT_1808916 [Lentinula boryana]|uniref:Uncharacterized protein n=1 Tax=Lentinula boryana TaxID=40481 RepID=A0ABQ8Q9L2_9AGAR|nr:hypothetical protein F5050DRAFT_1808916 [Lentinula boryana]
MTTLPSFVELMASLGINATDEQPERELECHAPSSSHSSPSSSPKMLGVSTPSLRSKSSPSLRDQSHRSRTRYSPYSSTSIFARRRGSVSSVSSSSSSDMDSMSERSSSCSPTLKSSSPRMRKRAHDKYLVNVLGSSPDLSANTPISSYVRRKTPGTSPSSPSFPRETDDSRELSKPFTIPTLPSFLPLSARGEKTFSSSPNSDFDDSSSLSNYGLKQTELDVMSRRSRLHTGIRISTAPKITDVGERGVHHRIVHVA